MKQNIKFSKFQFLIIGILFLSFFLRFYNISSVPLWFDEEGSNFYSSKIIKTSAKLLETSQIHLFFEKLKNDTHYPFYYFFVYLYSIFFGNDESLRMISVMFSMLFLWVFYKLCRQFFDRETSLIAILIVAFHPFHIWYAQEARSYSMACFFSSFMIYIFIKAVKTDKKKYWFFFILISIFAVFTNYFSLLLLFLTSLFIDNRKKFVRWANSLIIILSLFLMFFKVFFEQVSFVKNTFWLNIPTKETLFSTLEVFNLGYSANSFQNLFGLVIFQLLFFYGIYRVYLINRRNSLIFLSFLFIPILLIYSLSKVLMPIYLNRQLLIFSPFYYIFIANGIRHIEFKEEKMFIGTIVICLLLFSTFQINRKCVPCSLRQKFIMGGSYPHHDNYIIYDELKKGYKKGDLIITSDMQGYLFSYLFFIKENERNGSELYKSYRYGFFPRSLNSFTKGYFGINDMIKTTRAEFCYFNPFKKGKFNIIKFDLNNQDFNRIWMISFAWDQFSKFEPQTDLVIPHLEKYLKKTFSFEKDLMKLELFEKNL